VRISRVTLRAQTALDTAIDAQCVQCVIENNLIEGARRGIRANTSFSRITENALDGCEDCLEVNGLSNRVLRNTVGGTSNGIVVNTDGHIIEDNHLHGRGTGCGLRIGATTGVIYRANVARGYACACSGSGTTDFCDEFGAGNLSAGQLHARSHVGPTGRGAPSPGRCARRPGRSAPACPTPGNRELRHPYPGGREIPWNRVERMKAARRGFRRRKGGRDAHSARRNRVDRERSDGDRPSSGMLSCKSVLSRQRRSSDRARGRRPAGRAARWREAVGQRNGKALEPLPIVRRNGDGGVEREPAREEGLESLGEGEIERRLFRAAGA